MKNYNNNNNNNNYNFKNSFNSNLNNNHNTNNNNQNNYNGIDVNQDGYLALRYYQKDLFELDSLLDDYSTGSNNNGGSKDDQEEEKVDKILNGLQRQIGYLTCLEFEHQQKNCNQKTQKSIPAILEQNQIQKFINYYSERVQNCFEILDSKSSNEAIVQLDSNFNDSHIASFLDEFKYKIPPVRPLPTKNINEQFNNNNNQSIINFNTFKSNNNSINNNNNIINVNYLKNQKESIENKLQKEQQKIIDQQLLHQQELEKYEKLKKDLENEHQKIKQQQQQLLLEKQQFQQQQQQIQQQQQYQNSKSNRYNTVDEDMEDSKESSFKSAKDQYIENQATKTNEKPSFVQNSLRKNTAANNNTSSSSNNTTAPTRKRKNFEVPVNKSIEEMEEQNNKKQINSNKGGSSGKNNTSGKAEEVNPNGIDNINGIPLDDEKLRNLEPVMLERICNEILEKKETVKWSDIAGLSEAKDQIKEMVVYPIMRPDLFKGLRNPPKGLLLFGPPGTGKTMIGRAIASEASATFFSISASTLTSKWIGEGEKMVRCLFAVARCYLPSVIFIDEIDSLLTQRSDNENEASRRIKTEFLIQWDGVAGNANDRMLLIGATNRPEELDEAARRRLSKRLYIPLPDFESRLALIKHLLSKETHDIHEDGMEQIAKLSEGYSGADMKALCTEAAYQPIRDLGSQIATASLDSIRPIQINDFVLAIKRVKPSVDQKELTSYREWNEKFGALN